MSEMSRDPAKGRPYLVKLFDPAFQAEELRYNGTVHLRRSQRRQQDGRLKVIMAKTYFGQMQALQKREQDLLLAAGNLTLPGGEQLRKRVCWVRKIEHVGEGTLDIAWAIEMSWHGFDLADWAVLLGKGDDAAMRSARFLLALARSALQGLHLLHQAGWVHCDITAENLCLPYIDGSLAQQGSAITGQFNADQLMIIDLGMTLPEPIERIRAVPFGDRMREFDPPFDTDSAAGKHRWQALPADQKERYRVRHPALLHAHHRAAKGDLAPLKALDWRVDLWALGRLIEQWSAASGLNPCGAASLIDALRTLGVDLLHLGSDPHYTGPLPHPALIAGINASLGQADEARGFVVPQASLPLSPKPATLASPEPQFSRSSAQTLLPPTSQKVGIALRTPALWMALAGLIALGAWSATGMPWFGAKRQAVDEPAPAFDAAAAAARAAAIQGSSPATAQPKPAKPAAPTLQPGQDFEAYPGGPKLVLLPGGSYRRGSEAEDGRDDDEGRVKVVTINPGLAMGQTEVTRGQFGQFVADTGYKTDAERGDGCYGWTGSEWKKETRVNWRQLGFDQTDAHPVVCVSWNDAGKYIEWLNKKAGIAPTATGRYRLPSEAEWEYAARDVTRPDEKLSRNGKQHARFFWGDDPGYNKLCQYGNVADASAKKRFNWSGTADCDDGYAFTAPVASFAHSPNFKLYDMVGNAWEWTQDCKASYDDGVHTDGRAWEPADKVAVCARVLRGGSWSNGPRDQRPAGRNGSAPDYRVNYTGFRLARTLFIP